MVTVSPSECEGAPTWAYTLQLPHDPRAARIARVTLRAVLAGHGMTQLQHAAELVATELVTNAYRYSTGPATLRLRGLDRSRLRVSVWDADPHIPPPFDNKQRSVPPRPAPPEADGGRGLFLVCHYAQVWGGYPLGGDLFGPGGKLLWCEVGVSAADRAASGA
ncbi:ATP-binding protein [Streptomyces sp. NBC_01275]|uniref:ATP-binding protein n=1 Tax=Streptomyces sp. NBC_01275 TaxID=2903807 RepID=UPI00224EE04C|nr:ATP-binding protein [Streptomyces sp. NBC_01275]MCX4762124.1 ATP-binding protein [Streptomyces sp. NBC_01275]